MSIKTGVACASKECKDHPGMEGSVQSVCCLFLKQESTDCVIFCQGRIQYCRDKQEIHHTSSVILGITKSRHESYVTKKNLRNVTQVILIEVKDGKFPLKYHDGVNCS